MHQRKSKKILIYFFLIIAVSSINNLSLHNLKFKNITDIKIFGLSKKENNILFQEIKKMNLENILFINKNEISHLFDTNSLIEYYEVKKKVSIDNLCKNSKDKFFRENKY